MEDDHNPDRNKFTQIVNDRNFNRVKDLFDDAIEKGAEVVFGGVFDASDRTISPTVLKNVTPDMKIMQEEIFAPILPMMNYEDIDEVIDYVNDRDKPLALYVFSHNQDLIDNVLQHTTSGNAPSTMLSFTSVTSTCHSAASTQAESGPIMGYMDLKSFLMRKVYLFKPLNNHSEENLHHLAGSLSLSPNLSIIL